MSDQRIVTAHYTTDALLERVGEALRHAGLEGDAVTWSDFAPLDQFHLRGLAATKELAAELNIDARSTVLDVGTGLGGSARFLAATYGCRVVGIDLNAAFVEVAAMLARRAGLADRTRFQQADALALPFANGSVDHAWTQHVAMNIQDRARFYGEVHRVVRPGGLFAIYDVVIGNGQPLIFPVPWARRPEISFLLTPDAMRDVLTASGFAVVSWADKTDAVLAWLAQRDAAGQRESSPLGIHVVMGPEFADMTRNAGRNIREGRARLVQAIVRRA